MPGGMGLYMQVFEIAPTGGFRHLWPLLPVVIVLGIAIFIAIALLVPTKIEVSAAGIRIRNTLYGRFIPAEKLRTEAARVVNLSTSPQLAPARRTNGSGLPGYQAGWFRLRNGEKALVFLTDRQHAIYLPTSEGYSLLVSPKQPDQFVSQLRALAPV